MKTGAFDLDDDCGDDAHVLLVTDSCEQLSQCNCTVVQLQSLFSVSSRWLHWRFYKNLKQHEHTSVNYLSQQAKQPSTDVGLITESSCMKLILPGVGELSIPEEAPQLIRL